MSHQLTLAHLPISPPPTDSYNVELKTAEIIRLAVLGAVILVYGQVMNADVAEARNTPATQMRLCDVVMIVALISFVAINAVATTFSRRFSPWWA